ncbi:hypothetical protein [Mycolicibacterium hodleri]|uniref:Uncharacterized protein n=1 Tax=Mycolicibacterium hodleri TaxID=49897 RepID=A0A502E6I5_9MYCO|nr:hypothetical protein [Mycolicibacterium hodleri]TPG32442.1 hypothetical protein EAH80_19400 [Mycolicibacterium hodleri]
MYDPYAVLVAVDAHRVGVLALAGVTIIGMAMWFSQAFVMAKRDATYSFPIFCSVFWFAHDTSYVARFDQWFNVYDHWFLKLFWAALVLTSLMEVVYLRQTYRYGRSELFPHVSQRVFTALLAAAVAFGMVIWWMVKATLEDDLYVIAFGLTVVVYPPFAIALTLRRRSTRGQSTLMWVGFTVLAIGWFTVTTTYFGPAFQSWQWITTGIFAALGGSAGIWLTMAGTRYGLVDERDSADASRTAARVLG